MYQPRCDLHVLSLDWPDNPGDLWLWGPGLSGLTPLTRVFDCLAEQFHLPRWERIEWRSRDRGTIEGLLIDLLDYREGERYPLVVQTHGGPASSDRFGFGGSATRYHPVLAAQGYAIFKPNYRGSTGYGNAFLRDMVGHYFHNSHLDVLSGVDFLVQRRIGDPERLVKMGWSAGGHMTNKVITVTDRFRAASSGAGAVHWISMYAQSDVRTYRTPWFGGSPWEEGGPVENYWEHSPLKEIARVRTPP